MTTIFERSALEFYGLQPAPEVARIVRDHRGQHVVTWADVLKERREHQKLILRRKRWVAEWRPWKVWVAFFDQDIYGGWQGFIENRGGRIWIDRDCARLIPRLMQLFPLVLGFERVWDRPAWDQWKIEFARQHRRGTRCRRPRGSTVVWWDGESQPSLSPPSVASMKP